MNNRRAYLVYLWMEAGSSFLSALIFTVAAIYRIETAHLSPFQLVLVGTTLEASAFLFEIPTGVVADTYSRRLSIIIGMCMLGIAEMLEGSIPVFAAIILAQVVSGMGYTFLSGATEAWIADELGESSLGRVYMRAAQVGQGASILGIIASVGLATVSLNLPIVLGGALFVLLGVALMLTMPETGFKRGHVSEREGWRQLGGTFVSGLRLVRVSPLLITIFGIAAFAGASSEGFDRLWQDHFLKDFTFPKAGHIQPVLWFGLIEILSMLLTIVVTEALRRRLNTDDHHAMTKVLLALYMVLIASTVAFGLVNGFVLAVVAYLGARLMRSLASPLFTTWLNQNVTSKVRATVMSMAGQSDALGQMIVGPGIGAIGSLVSIRAAIVATGLVLTPALWLYSQALGHSQKPVVEAP